MLASLQGKAFAREYRSRIGHLAFGILAATRAGRGEGAVDATPSYEFDGSLPCKINPAGSKSEAKAIYRLWKDQFVMQRLDRVRANAEKIRQIVERHSATNPRVFGSTARGDDRPNSDIDILVDMKPMMSIFDILHIQDDLEGLLGESVDVVVDSSIPADARAKIEREAVPL